MGCRQWIGDNQIIKQKGVGTDIKPGGTPTFIGNDWSRTISIRTGMAGLLKEFDIHNTRRGTVSTEDLRATCSYLARSDGESGRAASVAKCWAHSTIRCVFTPFGRFRFPWVRKLVIKRLISWIIMSVKLETVMEMSKVKQKPLQR